MTWPVAELAPLVIPVLDLRGGQVVRGIAGERSQYRPIETPLVAGSDPLDVAAAIRDRYGLNSLYIADLDGIERRAPDYGAIDRLASAGFRLSVDAGLRTTDDAQRLFDLGVGRVIAGLESSTGPDAIAQLIQAGGSDRVIFSLDLRGGEPLAASDSSWCGQSPHRIARTVVSLGVQTLLVLDLAGVGRENGLPTLDFLRELRALEPAVDLWTGGGVRDDRDLTAAATAGADAVLVASALHTGRVRRVPVPVRRGEHAAFTEPQTDRRLLLTELSPPGRGAVSTIQIRGPLASLDQPTPLFLAANRRALADQPLNRVCFGRWGTESPEDVVLCRIETDVVEVHCHGGLAAVQRIMADVQGRGGTVQSAGEWLRETLSPLEAECEAALCRATTERTAMLLAEQRSGVLRRGLERIHEQLRLAATGDSPSLIAARQSIDGLLAWSRFGLHLSRPWSVVLCGRPNAGKSSLINALAGFTRSIVSPQPGTTRDVVTVQIVLEGWPIELSDTAGLRAAADEIEAAGVERARSRLHAADLKLLLLDASQPLTTDDHQLLDEHPEALVIAHKCDLPRRWNLSERKVLLVSSITSAGLPELMHSITRRLVGTVPDAATPLPMSDSLVAALRRVRTALADGEAPIAAEVLASWLHRAATASKETLHD